MEQLGSADAGQAALGLALMLLGWGVWGLGYLLQQMRASARRQPSEN
jgi:hypothetical protein